MKNNVKKALNHQQGSIPIDFGSTPVTGIHVSIIEKLRQYYGLKKDLVKVIDPMQMLGQIDDDLKEAMGVSFVGLYAPTNIYGFKNENWKEYKTHWGQTVLVPKDFNYTCSKENTYLYAKGDLNFSPCAVMPKSGFFFNTITRQENIDDECLNSDDNLEEFTKIGDETLKHYENEIKNLKNTPYSITGNFGGTAIGDIALVPGPMLTAPKGIRDVEEWYISTVMRPDYLHEIFEKQTAIAIYNLQRIFDVVKNDIDTIFICGTDFGTQSSLFCSKQTYENLYMPYYKIINDWIHQNTEWKTFKHSCGAVAELLPSIIESGFDIINPVQWSAKGMDREMLKKDFGEDLVFWGGGIDTQKTLPFGSAEQVREEVLKSCEIFSKDGGFVFNTIHNIQALIPVENVVAMLDAVHEFN